MCNYSRQIVEHFMNPRNLGELPNADLTVEEADPCCGDRIRLQALVGSGRIRRCMFLAHGCATSLALGSMLSEAVVGKTSAELGDLDADRLTKLAGGLQPDQRHAARLAADAVGKLAHALTRDSKPARFVREWPVLNSLKGAST